MKTWLSILPADASGRSAFLRCEDGSRQAGLEQALRRGIHGPPEVKREEKNLFLGQYRERVLIALTLRQIAEKGTYPAVEKAMRDPLAHRLVISSQADLQAAGDYIRLAADRHLDFTTTSSPDFRGDIGLVVVAKEAVEREAILVEDRARALTKTGIPAPLVEAVGEKICPRCYDLIKVKAPDELQNYRQLGLLDRILGVPCPADCPE